MLKIAPEGLPFVLVFALLTLLTALAARVCTGFGGLACILLALVLLALTGFMFYFFRDPERCTPNRPDAFIAPADGRIIVIQNVLENRYFHERRRQISIFMSPANVHVNRAPCDGTVVSACHNAGQHLAAYLEGASLRNENSELVLSTSTIPILVRQVAGFVARRTVCRVKPGAALKQGERFGMIKFSSRLDVYLPDDVVVQVAIGDRVQAGETILATAAKGART